MFTLILRNNATNESRVYDGLKNVSSSKLYLEFKDFVTDLPDGEYTYAAFINDRDDTEVDVRPDVVDSVVTADGKEVEVRYLHPRVGLLRIGTPKGDDTHYENKKNDIYYYE